MSARFHGRTTPGQPADWHERAIVGTARRRLPLVPVAWFVCGVYVGIFIAMLGG